MKTYKAEMKLPAEAVEILAKLHGGGYEAFVAGGAVRSFLIGSEAKDYDIVTDAPEETLCSLFADTKAIGKAFGVVQVTINNKRFEVARYRQESGYTDGRRPDEIVYSSAVCDDVKRRDFTCNALYYDYLKCEIIDFCGGYEDIGDKILRCVGKPEERLVKEDCLRMMRAIRFASQLGFKIHKDTFSAIKKNATHILRVSVERIQDEFNKILLSDSYKGLKLLFNANLMYAVLPEVAVCAAFEQHNPYHCYNLFEHTLRTLKNFEQDFYRLDEKSQLIVKLSLLLHDIGKPYKCTVNNDRCRYIGHPEESARMSKEILTRLKYSREITEKVFKLVSSHDYDIPATAKSCKKLLNVLGEDLFALWKIVKYQDVKAHSDFNGIKKQYFGKLKKLDEIYNDIKQNGQCFTLESLKINGSDLIDAGYADGIQIGSKLKEIFELVLTDSLPNDYDVLLNYVLSTSDKV